MGVLDTVIVYLACGSPFGVYQLTRREKDPAGHHWLSAFASFVFWPGYLLALVIDRSPASRRKPSAHDEIESIRCRIERYAFKNKPTAPLFEFREVYYRYTGLALAWADESDPAQAALLFRIAGTPVSAAAASCVSRRNRKKLEFHLTLARNEFLDLISGLGSKAEGPAIVQLVIDLSERLGDPFGVEDLDALAPQPDKGDKPDGAVWKSHGHRVPTTR